MFEVINGEFKMALRDENQLSAFLNNGWTLANDGKNTVVKEVASKIVEEEQPQKKYSKTELAKMPVDDLRELAKAEGIEDVDTLNGVKLKEMLIEKFGL